MATESRSEIIREDGRDPAEVFAEMANEQELFEHLDIKLPSIPEPDAEEVINPNPDEGRADTGSEVIRLHKEA